MENYTAMKRNEVLPYITAAKKSSIKESMLYDSIYIMFKSRQNYRKGHQDKTHLCREGSGVHMAGVWCTGSVVS